MEGKIMSKTTRLLAVSAFALTAGFFGVTQLQAASMQSGDIVVAQAGGSGGSSGSGGAGGAGSGASGSGSNDSGRQFNEDSMSTNPSGRQSPPSAATSPPSPNPSQNMNQSGVPARCASITDQTKRQACINNGR
jgi:hypothetical protein